MKVKSKVENSLQKLENWIEKNHYKGYDPFDGLTSFFRPLTFGNLLMDRLLMQLIRQSPINLRPLFGVKPLDSNIGRGYITWGYITLVRLLGDEKYKIKAVEGLDWLLENKAPGFENCSWGKQFDYASRGGRYSKLEPITVWSSIIGQVFLDAYEILEDKKYLEKAESICNWILEIPRNQTNTGICFNYAAYQDGVCTIHNHNMLAAALLARTAKHTGNVEYPIAAKNAMRYSCTGQLPNGAWYYGESTNMHWIDNFHTGYNLDALKCYNEHTNDEDFIDNLKRGFEYFKNTFFESSGRPKYYHDRAYPIDIQCASQAIETLTKFSENDESILEMALNVTNWTIDNMQDETGYFYYRQYPFIKAKTPMIHWGQATMYKALALLLLKIDDRNLK